MIKLTGDKNTLIRRLTELKEDVIYDVMLDKHSDKRSLDSNSYYWKLINELGNALRMSKTDLHFKMLRDYGQSEDLIVKKEVNFESFHKYVDLIKENSRYKHYRYYKGSSDMNNKEMSILIDGVRQECINVGIDPDAYKKG